jgi:hypothetical protein
MELFNTLLAVGGLVISLATGIGAWMDKYDRRDSSSSGYSPSDWRVRSTSSGLPARREQVWGRLLQAKFEQDVAAFQAARAMVDLAQQMRSSEKK